MDTVQKKDSRLLQEHLYCLNEKERCIPLSVQITFNLRQKLYFHVFPTKTRVRKHLPWLSFEDLGTCSPVTLCRKNLESAAQLQSFKAHWEVNSLQALVETLRYASRFKLIEEIKQLLKTFVMHERCTDNPFSEKKQTHEPSQKRTVQVPSLVLRHAHFSTEQILENHLKMSQQEHHPENI